MTTNARSTSAPYRGYAAQESVTGEGVALELPVANLGSRLVSGVIDVRTDATDDAAALFDLVLLGDFVSLHLARHEGVDPGPVPVLGELKARLAT